MVETVYDLCQPFNVYNGVSHETRSKFFLPLGQFIAVWPQTWQWSKCRANPTQAISPCGALGKTTSVTPPTKAGGKVRVKALPSQIPKQNLSRLPLNEAYLGVLLFPPPPDGILVNRGVTLQQYVAGGSVCDLAFNTGLRVPGFKPRPSRFFFLSKEPYSTLSLQPGVKSLGGSPYFTLTCNLKDELPSIT